MTLDRTQGEDKKPKDSKDGKEKAKEKKAQALGMICLLCFHEQLNVELTPVACQCSRCRRDCQLQPAHLPFP